MSIQNPYQTSRSSTNGSGSSSSSPRPYSHNLPQNHQSSETCLAFDVTTRKIITQEETNTPKNAAAAAATSSTDEFASLWVPADLAIQATLNAEQEYSRRCHRIQTSRPLLSSLKETESTTNSIGLTQMVEDDAHQIQMSAEQRRLVVLMFEMRNHLEDYVEKSLGVVCSSHSCRSLNDKIKTLAALKRLPSNFVRAMHKIREYGNDAAHNRRPPCREECQRAVNEYRKLKESIG
jgi:hypothetical protein